MLSTKDSLSRVDKLDVLLSTEDSKKKYSCSHFDSLSHDGRLALECYLLKTVERLPITTIREISLSTEDSTHKSFCFTFWFGFGSRLLGTCITCGCSLLFTRFYWRLSQFCRKPESKRPSITYFLSRVLFHLSPPAGWTRLFTACNCIQVMYCAQLTRAIVVSVRTLCLVTYVNKRVGQSEKRLDLEIYWSISAQNGAKLKRKMSLCVLR